MASNASFAGHNVTLANLYFDLSAKNSEGKVRCKRCDVLLKYNSGHSNLASHVKLKHSDWQEALKRRLQGSTRNEFGSMDSHVTRVVTDEAKNMHRWIEWIVLADLPLYVVENERYRKNSSLKSTTYKTISKHMTNLLEIAKLNVKEALPKSFGIIFDGNRHASSNIHSQLFIT